jgi:translocation and assembly module TamA
MRFLGSDVGVAQVLANGRYLLPLPWDLMATFRAQGAASYEKDPLSDMPASLRFFTVATTACAASLITLSDRRTRQVRSSEARI